MGIRIVVVDDHEVIRRGLTALLSDTVIEVVGDAARGADVLQVVDSAVPAIVLLDVRLPDVDGLSVLALLRKQRPAVKVIMLSSYDAPAYVAGAVALGASGFLRKTISGKQLTSAIEWVAAGNELWTSEQLRSSSRMSTFPRVVDAIEIPLTSREADVLRHIAEGLSNKEIARVLKISCDTVKEYVQRLLRKLGVVDRTQAAIWAVRKEIV